MISVYTYLSLPVLLFLKMALYFWMKRVHSPGSLTERLDESELSADSPIERLDESELSDSASLTNTVRDSDISGPALTSARFSSMQEGP